MCESLKLIEELECVVNKMHSHIKDLRARQIDVSLMRNDIQHELENKEPTNASAYNLSQAYHLLSKERRIVTDEIELLQETLDKIDESFGHIMHYRNKKEREYAARKMKRSRGSEVYMSRRLDLDDNVLRQVKNYLK